MQIVSKAVGIDLGTTNSAVAMMNPSDSEILLHRDPVGQRETTPSCVWKDPRSGEILVGHKAFRRIGTTPSPLRSIKRIMGKQQSVRLTDIDVTPEQASAFILAEMKRQIEEDASRLADAQTEWIVDRAVITVPAYFDQPQIDATRRAGERAGLEVLDLLHEPTAAACYHCWRTGTRNGVFLVYDLGGGTFDVTVLRCADGQFEVLGISGNNMLGGDDLDRAIADFLLERLVREAYALNLDLRGSEEDRLLYEQIRLLAEGVKKGLSNAGEFVLRDTSLRDQEGQVLTLDTLLERPEIEAVMRPYVEQTLTYCYEALELSGRSAGVGLAEVDAILLAGGSTHVPLVRELVRQTFCADASVREARAKCAEPVYEKVDTVVALGAAIRASATGGLAVYNPERTVRVSFRGTGTTGARTARVAGKVEALAGGLDLSGGRVALRSGDYTDEEELKEEGTFAFQEVPLQAGTENLLTFEVLDALGEVLAVAGRPVSQTRGEARPTGGSSGTAVLAKPILLQVERTGGGAAMRELLPALDSLPASRDYTFTHPGAETVLLPLYQMKRRIQEIRVPVPSGVPKGTLVEINIHVDALLLITVKGKIGDVEFSAAVDIPPDRPMPTNGDMDKLQQEFEAATAYLPPGRQAPVKARFDKLRKGFEAAASRNDDAQAVHDFEEMEEIVSSLASTQGPLSPPKEHLDDLVRECLEINQYAAQVAAQHGKPYDHTEAAKGIEAQRQQGERAWAHNDQKSYGDVILALEKLRNWIIGLVQQIVGPREDSRSEQEKVAGHCEYASEQAGKVGRLAQAQGRQDLVDEAEQIRRQLAALAQEAQKDPHRVRDKVQQLVARLDQIKNVIMGRRADSQDGSLVIDTE